MMRLLVTGATGFIGSRVAMRAARAGHEVQATARRPSRALERELGLSLTALDVLDPALGSRSLAADAIIHCATANDVVSRDAAAGIDLTVNGTRHVLELARRSGIPQVVFLSTLQVLGQELEGTIAEEAPPRCESPYALNHLMGEEACRTHERLHGGKVILLRPANVYGVPDVSSVDRSTLVPTCFVEQARTTGRIELRTSGRQRRNFVSTDEVASACLHVVDHLPMGCHAVTVGSNWVASIREVAEMVARVGTEVMGSPLEVEAPAGEERSNDFVLASRLDVLRPTRDASVQCMIRVIKRLFDGPARNP